MSELASGTAPPVADELERLSAELDAATTRADNLERGLTSSREIGMAVGIVMHQRKLGADAAFTLLQTVSRDTNRKVSAIASVVVFTGALHPDL